MTTEEMRATLTLCLLASFADGEKHEREREQIRQVAEGLAADQQINLPHLYQDVLLRRVQLSDVLAQLQTTESRQLAYEMALCVCEADGSTSPKEAEFLAQLREAFGTAGQAPGPSAAPAVAAATGMAAAATLATPPAQALAGNLVFLLGQLLAETLTQGALCTDGSQVGADAFLFSDGFVQGLNGLILRLLGLTQLTTQLDQLVHPGLLRAVLAVSTPLQQHVLVDFFQTQFHMVLQA